ncbi:MAG: hydroxymethylbilane synthase [Chloroflexota bacterium]
MQPTRITIGTRGSRLALRQSQLIRDLLKARFPRMDARIMTIETEADLLQDRSISSLGDKGVFVRSIERALLERRIDVAVHSLKDVPADIVTPDLALAAFSARADPRDVLISRSGVGFDELPAGARIGTSSPRRHMQLRELRPDLDCVGIRGNVDTRLRKLEEGQFQAIVLAAAGLKRLGLADRVTEYLEVDRMTPDAGQGVIAIQTRQDGPIPEMVAAIDQLESRVCVLAERAVVRSLGAGCNSPVGVFAELHGSSITVRGIAAAAVGELTHRDEEVGSVDEPELVGTRLGVRLAARIGVAPYTGT